MELWKKTSLCAEDNGCVQSCAVSASPLQQFLDEEERGGGADPAVAEQSLPVAGGEDRVEWEHGVEEGERERERGGKLAARRRFCFCEMCPPGVGTVGSRSDTPLSVV